MTAICIRSVQGSLRIWVTTLTNVYLKITRGNFLISRKCWKNETIKAYSLETTKYFCIIFCLHEFIKRSSIYSAARKRIDPYDRSIDRLNTISLSSLNLQRMNSCHFSLLSREMNFANVLRPTNYVNFTHQKRFLKKHWIYFFSTATVSTVRP